MSNVVCTRDGLKINGQPLYLLAGQVHYFRYPRAEWRDILLKARAAGLNTIDTVIPWNLHEPTPGEFNFSDMADLPGYIDLCAELGLYLTARPGPYICAEWENGGIPAWLGRADEVAYRLDQPAYLEPLLHWFDRLIPLLAEQQLDRGGPLILVQIENEHWASGVYGHDAHQETLAQAMIARGITVPFYTCMGPGDNWPEFRNGWAGIDRKLLQTRQVWPDAPLIVSELWSGWFDNWGSSRHTGKTAASLDQRLHELTAIGASGFSHWMWAGGTNFAFWGGRTVGGDAIHMTTSYDYDAPVSEYGGLTEKYYVARRHHLLLGTLGTRLAALLAGAEPGGPHVLTAKAVAGRAAGGGSILRNVRNGSFTATYLRNDTSERQTYQLFVETDSAPRPLHLPIDVEPTAIKPIFTHLPLTGALTLRYHTGRLLGFWRMAGADVLVVYGYEGEKGRLSLLGESWQMIEPDGVDCRVDGKELHLGYWLTDRPGVVRTATLTIILLTQARAERCWPAGERGFVVGPHFLGDYLEDDEGRVTSQIDPRGVRPYYGLGSDGTRRLISPPAKPQPSTPPALGPWQTLPVAELISDAGWPALNRPQPFEALGCTLGYGWYRALVDSPERETTLAAPGLNDRGHLFVDGQYAGTLGLGPDGPTLALPLSLAAGRHDLRLLVDNLGRFNYGSGLGERKGLLDTLYWGGQQRDLTQGWTALWQEAYFAGEAIAGAKPAHIRADATEVDLSSFPFTGSDVWLLREFEVAAGRRAVLYFTGDRNPGALFVNGRQVTRFSRHYGGGFHKYDVTDWLRADGPNVIALFIRDYSGLPWRGTLLTYDPAQALDATWFFRAGITPVDNGPGTADHAHLPKFFRSRFTYNPAIHGDGPFKVSLHGLHKGQLWLNERNLGRYWQIGPQEFYKLPVSWLEPENELLIFEEQDGSPEEVQIWVETVETS